MEFGDIVMFRDIFGVDSKIIGYNAKIEKWDYSKL